VRMGKPKIHNPQFGNQSIAVTESTDSTLIERCALAALSGVLSNSNYRIEAIAQKQPDYVIALCELSYSIAEKMQSVIEKRRK
jgi:hypothetical protein